MMDSNNLSLYNSTVVSQHQQNGNFEIDTKFFQVNSFGLPVTSENQLQDKMLNPNTIQPPQPLQNTTYYWSEFNQLGPSNPNWGYSYPNYSMPQPPLAVPVSDYGNSSQAGPQVAVGPPFHPAEHQNAVMTNNPGSPYFPSQQPMHAQANFHLVQNDVTSPGSRHSAFQYVHSTSASMHGAIKPETINETDMQTIRSAQEVDSNQRSAGMSPGGATNQNVQTNSKPSKSSTPRRRSTGVSTKSSASSSERQNNGGNSSESYECNICNKVYEHRDSLRRHKRDFHKIEVASAKPRGQPTDFQCDICGKYLSNRCSLKRHKKSALCSKTLEAAENSNSQTKTDNAVLSSSDISNENLTQGSYDSEKLTFHGQDAIAGSKPSTSQQLNGEIKKSKPKAANDKQFAQNGKSESCHICNKEFANRRGLGKHLKRVHNGEKESKLTKKELKQIAQQKRIEAVMSGENHSVPNAADNQITNEGVAVARLKMEEQKPEISQHLFPEPVLRNFELHNSQDGTDTSSSSKEMASSVAGGITPNPTDKDLKKCDVCNKVLKKVNIARHMKSAHKLEADENSDSKMKYAKVECNYCQAVMLKGNLPRHKRSHHKLEYEKEKEMQGSPSSVEIPKSAKKAKYDAPASNGDGNFSNEYRPNHEIKQETHQFHTPWSEAAPVQGINASQAHDFRNVNDVTGMGQVQQYPLVSQAPTNAEVQMGNLDYRNFNPVMADDQNRMTFIQHSNNPPMDVLGYSHINNADPGQPHLPYGQPPNHLGINMLDYGNLDRSDAYNPVIFAQTPNNQVLDMMDYSLGNENPQRQDLQMFSQVPNHPDLDLLNYRHMDRTDVRDRDGLMMFPSNDQNLNLLNYGNVHENMIDIHQQGQPPAFQPPPPSNPDLQNYRHLESTVQASDLNLNVAIPGSNAKQNPASDTSECPICEKMVPTSELYQHKISHELICHICGKDDIRLPDVPAHGQTHVASLDCELCGYKAQAKIKLWEHMNTHLRIKPLICLECGWSFGNSGSVQYHMKSQHSSPADLFKCDHCEKTFVTEQAKRGHELSHYGTTCPFCKQEFPRKKDLADHIKADHRRKRQAS